MKRIYTFKTLTPGMDLSDAHDIRTPVFIDEQGFSQELEYDEIDAIAHHIVMYNDGLPVACGRVFPKKDSPQCYVVGRVAVLKNLRGSGAGLILMNKLEELCGQLGATKTMLRAQCHALEFYKKCGYTPYGEVYLEEGCPHIDMEKTL